MDSPTFSGICRNPRMIRIATVSFLLGCLLFFGGDWIHKHDATLDLLGWLRPADWNVPKASSIAHITKPTNATLLEKVPSYMKPILDSEDTTYNRLACPVPTEDRYLYLRGSPDENAGGSNSPPKYFFALNLHECAHVLPRLLGSILETIKFLGPRNCALSIVEGRSNDGTFEILLSLVQELADIGITMFFNTHGADPTTGDRIASLATLRNLALEPLLRSYSNYSTMDDTTIIFVNDVAICMEDILELVHQRQYQEADMTCAMDWAYVGRDPTFYDVWISRGMNGDAFFNIPEPGNYDQAWNLHWNNPSARIAQLQGKPYQVFSCWNGAVAFTSRPFLEQKIRFRTHYEGECGQGEPKSLCMDFWHHGYGRIAVVPSVNLIYSDEEAEKIKALKGYTSEIVETAEMLGGGEERIQWEKKPPESVKCMTEQKWVNWEEELDEHDSTRGSDLKLHR